MLVDEANLFPLIDDNTEAVEAPDVPSQIFPGQKHQLHFYPGLAYLIEKLVLDIELSFRHFPHPYADTSLMAEQRPLRTSEIGKGENPEPHSGAEKILNNILDPVKILGIKPQCLGFGTKPSELPFGVATSISLHRPDGLVTILFS